MMTYGVPVYHQPETETKTVVIIIITYNIIQLTDLGQI